MKKIISLILVLAMPFLMACGSTKTVAAAAGSEAPAAESQASGQARWTPPADSAAASSLPSAQPAENSAASAEPAVQAEEPAEEQPFPDVGGPSTQVLEILGKPDRSELGQNSNHKYYNREFQGIEFESIEVDMTSDGTVWLINLVADETTDQDLLMTFMQNWADALQQTHGTPAVSRFDNKTTYDWQDISLDISRYPEVNILDYHIGLFWKLY